LKRTMAALVLGNSAYPDGNELDNPVNDATDLGAKLKSYGFDVIVAKDRTVKEMHKAFLRPLTREAAQAFRIALVSGRDPSQCR
jgi:uncharacterized caspase-like protein